ncbi:MAG: 50S ribosomal protein L29 [Chloroflexi bacterium]|nr:50S ribosomal protein L29 [Chloroflexota bacterium]
MLRAEELRDLTMDELGLRLDEAKEEHFNLRFQREIGQLQDINRLKVVRRNIARIKTVMREKELEAEGGQ